MANATKENKKAVETKEVKSAKVEKIEDNKVETRKVVVDLPADKLDEFKVFAQLCNATQGETITKVIVATLEKNKEAIAQFSSVRNSIQF